MTTAGQVQANGHGDYAAFLSSKRIMAQTVGLDVPAEAIHPALYDFQRDIVQWALRRGRAALWEDCGLGKTIQQLEWARHVGGTILIVAPLCVSEQTIHEGQEKLGLDVHFVRSADQVRPGISITNYEMLDHFVGVPLTGLVCDESSILASLAGVTRTLLLKQFTEVRYKLACTATPCPNDIAELANHSEFLGILTREEMLASFFVHDDEGWRLRGHARKPFFRWLSSWAMAIKTPADLGYDGSRFVLPSLTIHDVVVETEWRKPGELFAGELKGITDRIDVRRQSITDRVAAAARLANDYAGQVVVWCALNEEAEAMVKAIPDAIEIKGTDSYEHKVELLHRFLDGRKRVLVSKPRICGRGLNLQNAARQIFMGLGDSFQDYYQCIRRSWRYRQTQPVDIFVTVTDHETEIVENVRRKEQEALILTQEIIDAAREHELAELHRGGPSEVIERAVYDGPFWRLYQGDAAEELKHIVSDSVHLSVFSPPFLALYTYSATEQDLGNCRTADEFFTHFGYVIDELFRVTMPGRVCCVHVSQVPAMLVRDGYIGMKDFRADVVRAYESRQWVYQGEVVIDKDPQAQAIRTHSKGLAFAQLKRDASWLRPALADYILIFRKPGENRLPIQPDISNDEWIEWARPIWYGIKESDTLQVAHARSPDDDRHVCPLQLGTIERCIRLWSNKYDLVLSPFAGIGSEGYMALKLKRRFVGIELKPLYAKVAAQNLQAALQQADEPDLFSAEEA